MIKQVYSEKELGLSKCGAEAQKIRALLKSYGMKYDFCRFYRADSFAVAIFYDEIVICETDSNAANSVAADFEELCEFISFCGFSRIFCAEKTGKMLSKALLTDSKKLNLMKFSGAAQKLSADITEISLSQAYEILKTAFDFDYEQWYLDMSHRTRHNISRFYGFNGSVLCVQHDFCGEALLSQIATLPENRGKGNASRLILSVCEKLESDVFLLCEDALLGFYEKIGFKKVGINYELYKK